jgi:HAMP domain-containing protein
MKLAEALILRADSQKRIEQLRQRLVRTAKVQEGDRPAEEPQALLDEIEQTASELTRLIQRINRTNSSVELQEGQTVSDALALRDVQQLKQGVYRDLAKAAAVTQDRMTRSEVKFHSTVDVQDVLRRADGLAKEHRELDARIQALNWRTDLQD